MSKTAVKPLEEIVNREFKVVSAVFRPEYAETALEVNRLEEAIDDLTRQIAVFTGDIFGHASLFKKRDMLVEEMRTLLGTKFTTSLTFEREFNGTIFSSIHHSIDGNAVLDEGLVLTIKAAVINRNTVGKNGAIPNIEKIDLVLRTDGVSTAAALAKRWLNRWLSTFRKKERRNIEVYDIFDFRCVEELPPKPAVDAKH